MVGSVKIGLIALPEEVKCVRWKDNNTVCCLLEEYQHLNSPFKEGKCPWKAADYDVWIELAMILKDCVRDDKVKDLIVMEFKLFTEVKKGQSWHLNRTFLLKGSHLYINILITCGICNCMCTVQQQRREEENYSFESKHRFVYCWHSVEKQDYNNIEGSRLQTLKTRTLCSMSLRH